MHYFRCLLSVALFLATQPLHAAATSDAVTAMSRPEYVEPFSRGSVMQLLSGLILVVSLIFLLAWFVRRYTGLPGQSRGLKVITSLPLGTREKLVLVQAGDKQLLLGVAPGRVSLLERFDQPLINQEHASGGEFASKLQQVMSRKNAE